MPFLELSLRCRQDEQPRYEHAFDDVGALAVTLLDADEEFAVGTQDEHGGYSTTRSRTGNQALRTPSMRIQSPSCATARASNHAP